MLAEEAGVVSDIDNRLLAKVAKLAGAPADLASGVDLHVKCGHQVAKDQPLLTVHAEHVGELNYAVDYLLEHLSIVKIEGI